MLACWKHTHILELFQHMVKVVGSPSRQERGDPTLNKDHRY